MNKTILIAGGAAVASLAAGGVGGYFLAKKKFDATLDDLIALEVEKTKKYYSVLLMQAREKPESLEELATEDAGGEGGADEEECVTPREGWSEAVQAAKESGRASTANNASKAMVDYQSYATKPPLSEVVPSNIFAKDKSKKELPPRDPQTGHFLPKNTVEPTQTDDPYLITHEEFLQGEMEYDQENLFYFIRDETLIMVADNESVDIDRVGEVNLTLFPKTPKDEPSIICVRNDGLQIDYEIHLRHDSITEYLGLGEDEESHRYV